MLRHNFWREIVKRAWAGYVAVWLRRFERTHWPLTNQCLADIKLRFVSLSRPLSILEFIRTRAILLT